MNIIDLILMDHDYLKDCIKVIKSKDESRAKKLARASHFLDTLEKHSKAEKASFYTPLKQKKELKPFILEAEIEHGLVDEKVTMLKGQIRRGTKKDELFAELKVLAELVQHHLRQEERDFLPEVKRLVDNAQLIKLAEEFFDLRRFTEKDLATWSPHFPFRDKLVELFQQATR